MENETSTTLTGDVQAADALRALQVADPRLHGGTSVRAADPLALVREQLADSQPQPASAAAPESVRAGTGNYR